VVLGVALLCAAAVAEEKPEGNPEGVDRIMQMRITAEFQSASVRKVVEFVTAQTALNYMATDECLDQKRTVTVKVKDMPVGRLLDFLCEEMGVRIRVDGETRTLVLGRREKGEDRPRHAPQLEHKRALKMVTDHTQVKELLKTRPGIRIHLRWEERERIWKADLVRGKEGEGEEAEWMGMAAIREYEESKPRIVAVHLSEAVLRHDGKEKKERRREKPPREDREQRREKPARKKEVREKAGPGAEERAF